MFIPPFPMDSYYYTMDGACKTGKIIGPPQAARVQRGAPLIYCAPACGGKVVAPATKGGERFSLARRAVCMFSHGRSPVVKVLFILAAKPPTTTLTAEGRVKLSNPRAKGASNLGPKARHPSRPQGVSIIKKTAPKRAVSYFLITRDGRPAWGRRNGGWCPRSGRCRFCSGEPG